MKTKNLFLISLLSLASLHIKTNDTQESESQVENVLAEDAVENIVAEDQLEVAPVAEVNPIPAEIKPYSRAVMMWVRAGQTPEERSQRAALILKWNYANDAQIAALSSFIISEVQAVEQTN